MIPGVTSAQILSASRSDPYWSFVKALLHFNGTDGSTSIVDETGRSWSSSGNAQLDTAQKKFGSSSLLLDGNGDFVSTAHSTDFSVSSGDATIEAWIRLRVGGKVHTISNKRDSTGAEEHSFQVGAEDKLQMVVFNGTPVVTLLGTTALSIGAWHHVASCKQGNDWFLFLDGVLEASGTQTGPCSTNSEPLKIGRDGFNFTRDFDGHVDEYRFTKGVARYTENFIPPSRPFPNS